MKRARTTLLAATTAIAFSWISLAQETAPEKPDPDFAKVPGEPTAAENTAREASTATAWHNALNAAHQIAASRGYRQRNSHTTGSIPGEGFTIIPLQLYAGNDYYICLGTDAPIEEISAAAFDPDQRLVKSAPSRANGKLVLRIRPKKTGPHYLRLHHTDPREAKSYYALTYIYK